MITLRFPDGSTREVESGLNPLEIAQGLSRSLAKAALAAKVNGTTVSLLQPVSESCDFQILTWDDPEGRAVYWHSSAHVMAQAVKELWPEARLDDGPPEETGFFYDISFPTPLSETDFPRIEARVAEVLKRKSKMVRRELTAAEAREFFKDKGEDFKLDLIDAIEARGENITVYDQGDWTDLCRGPHLPATDEIRNFKVMSMAGAYLRGDQENEQLTRLRAVTFPKQQMLTDYLFMLEEAKKRDHRKLGRELDLYSVHEVGPGFPFWHPNGMVVYNSLAQFWRELHTADGYSEIKTPIILSEELWHKSGHWANYHDNMYFTEIDESTYAVKPMNCPGCCMVYSSIPHSYRELPIRMGEMGLVHRHEKSGALQGLMRVRQFTQDDAHIFCLNEQIEDEILKVIRLIDRIYGTFGFEYKMELSTRPEEKFIGSLEMWDNAENMLKGALTSWGVPYKLNPGDGAFYGPKIDFHIMDSLRRSWQCATIQLDFSMPERFGLEYVGEDGERHRPVMIHRAIFGSFERFIGILVEHFAGNFPTWLAPVQVAVLPLTDSQLEAATAVYQALQQAGIRAHLETRSEKIGYKIRLAETRKIPWMLVIGAREAEENKVAVRRHGHGDLGQMSTPDFIERIREEIATRALDLSHQPGGPEHRQG